MPLLGNLTNNGVGNPTISCNATVDNAGKIGKCYVCASGNHISFTNPITTSTTDFAISCWIYVTEYTSGYSNVFSSRTATSGKGLALWVQSGSIRFDDGENWTVSNTFTLNTWTHICVTYSKTKGKAIYVNGNLIGSKATVGTLANLRSELFIGYDHYGYYLGGKINDVRVWEGSTISSREVAEIAKGLVLHYPLSNNESGVPSLSNFESVASIWVNDGESSLTDYTDPSYGNVLKISSVASKRIYKTVSNVWTTSGGKYTVSFLAKASFNGATCDMSRSLADFTPTFTLTTDWKRYSGVITLSGTATGGTLSFRTLTNVDYYITQIKLESGEIVTPWTPNSSELSYNKMGYNSTTEYDVSGFEYNGEKLGTIAYTSDTPRYNISTVFNGTDATINCGHAFHVQGAKNMSMSCWAYCENWTATTANKYLLSSQQTGGLILGYLNGTTVRARWHVYTASDLSASGYKQADYATALTSGWHHFCGTCNESQIKLYLDGVLVKTTSASNYGIHFNTTASMFIGAESAGASSYSDLFTGKISDVRIYYTTLTADQVADLYSTAASISDSGTLMGYEFVEM